jgi:ABC-2 type transport system ATP-binding protein
MLPDLSAMPGVHDLSLTDHTVTCTVDPEGLAPLLEALTTAGVRTMTSTPPTLEELFLDLYRSAP